MVQLVLTESFKSKTFRVYSLDLPEIMRAGPTKEAAFLSELDGEGILRRLEDRVQKNEMLTDEELMEFIILPLSYKKGRKKSRESGMRQALPCRFRTEASRFLHWQGYWHLRTRLLTGKRQTE